MCALNEVKGMKLKMKKRSKRYDLVIYISLILAFICVIISIIDNSNAGEIDFKEVPKDEIDSPSIPTDSVLENQDIEEPLELKNADKNSIVKKYLDEIADRVIKDEVITYNMIRTWNTYEVLDTIYERQIIDYYYAYKVNIKITGNNIDIPTSKNELLSKEDYTVITLTFNILKSGKQKGYIVKAIEIPNNA